MRDAGAVVDKGLYRLPFTVAVRVDFDALLPTMPGVFPGRLLSCGTTMWSFTVGGLESLQRFSRNVVLLKRSPW
jgi:hypothetical protein